MVYLRLLQCLYGVVAAAGGGIHYLGRIKKEDDRLKWETQCVFFRYSLFMPRTVLALLWPRVILDFSV